MELLQCTPSVPGDNGQWNCCNKLPHCLGAVGSATLAMHCHTAWAHWALKFLSCTATLPGGSGQWNSCNVPPHCLGAVVQLLQCTASLPGGGGQWNFCNARAHQLGGRGVLPRKWSPLKERNSCNALPHCLGAVGSGTLVTHCLFVRAQWAVEVLQCTASLLGGSGQCNSCNALPHRLGTWAVEVSQCAGPPAGGTGSPAKAAVGAYGGPAGDGSSQWPGPTSCGDGESCQGGGRCLWRACGGRQFPMAQAHQLGGRGVLP